MPCNRRERKIDMKLIERMFVGHQVAKCKRMMEEGKTAEEIVEELRKDNEFFYEQVMKVR
jgi:fatty acid-binding protein DegV